MIKTGPGRRGSGKNKGKYSTKLIEFIEFFQDPPILPIVPLPLPAMMSKKCKYALKALVRLGQGYKKGVLSTFMIAEEAQIPKKFLELILLDLKKAGYVASQQGAGGGYYLLKKPSQITVAEIYRLFDGAIALVPCASEKYYQKCYDCPSEKECPLHKTATLIRKRTYDVMARSTIQSML